MQESDFKVILSEMLGLDVEYALQAMGNSIELYNKLLAQIVSRTPSNIAEMDECISADNLEGFRVKVHGVKGSLRQANYSALAKRAQDLENAAKAGDIRHCVKHYGSFRSLLTDFSEKAQEALKLAEKTAPVTEDTGDIYEQLDALSKISEALEDYDTMTAMELLAPLASKRFGGEADALIANTMKELEMFSPDAALEQLKRLIDICT